MVKMESVTKITIVLKMMVKSGLEIWIGAFKSSKKWTFFVRISVLAPKMGQINKINAFYYIRL